MRRGGDIVVANHVQVSRAAFAQYTELGGELSQGTLARTLTKKEVKRWKDDCGYFILFESGWRFVFVVERGRQEQYLCRMTVVAIQLQYEKAN